MVDLALIRDLRLVGLCPELLRAALSYWDPVMHVFWFGDDELCPTVEEFQAYLRGFAASHVLVVPPLRENMKNLCR